MARWERAARLLPRTVRGPVLDLGCAFGWGTAKLARHHEVIGVDRSLTDLRRAQARLPHVALVCASADALPFKADTFGAVILLDVLEHLPDSTSEAHAAAEITRVTRDDARLIVSVPHRGLLAAADSLNLYQRLRRHWAALPPPPEIGEGWHRHYRPRDISGLFSQWATLGMWRTGLGCAELLHFPLLVLVRGVLGAHRVFAALQLIYFTAYIVEDTLPAGPLSYHLMVCLEKRDVADA